VRTSFTFVLVSTIPSDCKIYAQEESWELWN